MIVGNEKDNYISESTEMKTWIVTRATPQDLISMFLLKTIYQGKWKDAAQYLYSHNRLFSPFGKAVDDRIAVISPEIEGWTIMSSSKIWFEEAITIAERLSTKYSTVYVFYQDAHHGYQIIGNCRNGKIISTIATNENREVEVRGQLNEAEEQFFAKSHYWSFDLTDLLKEYAFDIKAFYKPSSYYLEHSFVVIMKQKEPHFSLDTLPLEIREFDIEAEEARNYFSDDATTDADEGTEDLPF